MKKLFTKIIVTLLCLSLFPFAFVGCVTENASGFISVETDSWKNVYIVGDSIDLTGLSINYYPDVDNLDEFTTHPVTLDMVKDFSTTTAGRKEFTVKYNGIESFGVSYDVFDDIPFSVNETFCVEDGIVAHLNSTTGKATVTKYSSFSSFMSSNGTTSVVDFVVSMTKSLFGNPIKVGKFVFEQKTYTYELVGGENHHITDTTNDGGSMSYNTSYYVTPFDKQNVPTPTFNKQYVSEVDGNGNKAIVIFNSNYDANIYIVDDAVTDVSTLTPTTMLTASQSSLSRTCRLHYVSKQGDVSIRLSLTSENELNLVKNSTSNGRYAYTCIYFNDTI